MSEIFRSHNQRRGSQESPEWLKNLLTAAGQRPINNIVDITNFVLLGIGQPLHCFDLGSRQGEEIIVRTCEKGTRFTTLDGVERELNEADLMICDAETDVHRGCFRWS